jgi:hypothetical protein
MGYRYFHSGEGKQHTSSQAYHDFADGLSYVSVKINRVLPAFSARAGKEKKKRVNKKKKKQESDSPLSIYL